MATHDMLIFYLFFLIIMVASCNAHGGSHPADGYPLFDDCVEYDQRACKPPGIYFIKIRSTGGYTRGTCATAQETGCAGNGWTEIAHIHGDSQDSVTSYNSEFWTTKTPNDTFANPGLFTSANVTAVCLSSPKFALSFPVRAPSFRSLFFEKKLLPIDANDWLSSLNNASLYQFSFSPSCYETGFNVGNESHVQARIGIVSKNIAGCNSTVQVIGVGIRVAGKSYNSLHGTVIGNSVNYTNVTIYVRSRPQPWSSLPHNVTTTAVPTS